MRKTTGRPVIMSMTVVRENLCRGEITIVRTAVQVETELSGFFHPEQTEYYTRQLECNGVFALPQDHLSPLHLPIQHWRTITRMLMAKRRTMVRSHRLDEPG
jgi:hypothetical protein